MDEGVAQANPWNTVCDAFFNRGNCSGLVDTSAIYLSDELEAVCFLGRHGRMGRFLLQTKGPRNAVIAPDQLAKFMTPSPMQASHNPR